MHVVYGAVYKGTETCIQISEMPLKWIKRVQGSAQGRLMSYNPSTGFTQVLADNIWQANGVAVSQDETFVVVASTGSTRLYRYWLKGSKVRLCDDHVFCTCRLH